MIKNDTWILQQCIENELIIPYVDKLIRKNETTGKKVISYGLSSFGYDIRLSPNDFRIFKHIPGTILDPKNFNPCNLDFARLHEDDNGKYFILPGHTYGLGVAVERINIPNNISVLCLGKSTYARCGIIANLTPAEAGWSGHLTLEFSNSSDTDCKIYTNEGVVQLLFFEGDSCNTSYNDRKGKYQNQLEIVTLARI